MAGLVLCLFGCGEPASVSVVEAPACGDDGARITENYGGVRASIDWDGRTLQCEGLPRPNGEGARLRFAGPAASSTYRIGGVLYCVAPFADLNGTASTSFADLRFTGRLDWQPDK